MKESGDTHSQNYDHADVVATTTGMNNNTGKANALCT